MAGCRKAAVKTVEELVIFTERGTAAEVRAAQAAERRAAEAAARGQRNKILEDGASNSFQQILENQQKKRDEDEKRRR